MSFPAGVVLSQGFDKYLHLYSKAVWDEQMEPALQGNILDERTGDLNVKFRAGKTESALDQKQGRVVIEQHLLDYAGITGSIKATRAGRYWRIEAA